MLLNREYHRPRTLAEALALLQRPGVRTVPLAGGTWLVPRLRQDLPPSEGYAPTSSHPGAVDAVVDLSDLGLSYLELGEDAAGTWLRLGAMTKLSTVASDPTVSRLADGLLSEAVSREGPVNLLNAATIGGCAVRADPQSELILTLLALAAYAIIERQESSPGISSSRQSLPLLDVVEAPERALEHGLLVEIRIPMPVEALRGGLARVARTPADRAIVAAAAVVGSDGARIAVGGVADHPVLLRLGPGWREEDAIEAVHKALTDIEIPGDFLGSPDYRYAMAPLVARRALAKAKT